MTQFNVTTSMKEMRPLRRSGLPDSEPMSRAQVQRLGNREMPRDLKRAGFNASVFVSDEAIHGERYYRISYSK